MKIFINKNIVIFLFCLSFLFANTPTLKLDGKDETVKTFSLAYYLGNVKDPHQLNTLFKDPKNIKIIPNAFALGYNTKEHWFHINVTNVTSQHQTYILYFTEQFQDHIDLFQLYPHYNQERNGLSVPMDKRSVHSIFPAFKLHFKPYEKKDIYLRIQSPFSIFGAFEFKTPQRFIHDEHLTAEIFYFYFGGMLSLALYNLFIFFYLKREVYLYYVGYVTFFTLWAALFKGFLTPYLTPDLFKISLITILSNYPQNTPYIYFYCFNSTYYNANKYTNRDYIP